MNDKSKASVGIAGAMAAVAAAFLTSHHGLLVGIVGGAVVGGIVGLVAQLVMRRSS